MPFTDVAWNYCDMKCISFEKLYPGVDFFVINFKDSLLKPDFSACYAKKVDGSVVLWDKVASNDWFQKNCGSESEDYLANSSKYPKDGTELGSGLGVLIDYWSITANHLI